MNNDKDDISTNVKNKFALLLTEERLQKRNNLKRWVVVGDGVTSHFLIFFSFLKSSLSVASGLLVIHLMSCVMIILLNIP